MPARTNARQAMVYMLRDMTRTGDTRVTESRLLRDSSTGYEREVDVVIDTTADGDPVTISMEVVNRSRPADRPWVEQMIKKHEHLPTNRLVLVSWSGFSRSAVAAAEAEGGWVVTMTPEQVQMHGLPVRENVTLVGVSLGQPVRIEVVLRDADEICTSRVQLDTAIFDSKGELLGNWGEYALYLSKLPEYRAPIDNAIERHGADGVDGATYSMSVVDLADRDVYMREDTGRQVQLHRAAISGFLHIEEVVVDLRLTVLGERAFRAGQAAFKGLDAVWMLIADVDGSTHVGMHFL
jgi:hypothetical protein